MMARYFFQAQYRGATLTDEIGEEFATPREAEVYARVVPRNLVGMVRRRACPSSAKMESCWRAATA